MNSQEQRLVDVYFAKFPHDQTLLDEVFGESFVFHHLQDITGIAAFRDFMRGVSRSFPDFRFDVHHILAARDLVAAHYDLSGTQHAMFLGTIPSRRRHFKVRGMSVFRFENGRIAEIWVVFNTLSMMQQLGARSEDLGWES